jgi:hypothetical protein
MTRARLDVAALGSSSSNGSLRKVWEEFALIARLLSALIVGIAMQGAALAATAGNDYPTEAVVDYVYACMKVNGETRESLSACSCSSRRARS